MRQAILATVVYALCFLLISHTASADPSQGASEKVFLGYVAGMPENINYGMYTHLCHAFVVADKEGKILPSENVPNHELAREAHKAGVKVLISLGGWGWDENFQAMSLNPAAEDRYVSAVMTLIDEYDYDGIDLDWEYPDTNIDIVGFERLSRRFRKQLDALGEKKDRPMLLTMAAAAHPMTLEWLSKAFLLETMDWVNIMTYDYVGSWADFVGHHAPLFASSKLPKDNVLSTEITMRYLLEEKKMPANRLALGLPLYGRVFAASEPYVSSVGLPKPSRASFNYNEIHKLQMQEKWQRKWDDETKTPWLFAPDRSEIIGYDDHESIALKTQWAVKQGFRGVFFWQIAADRMPDGSNPLQEASREKLFQQAP